MIGMMRIDTRWRNDWNDEQREHKFGTKRRRGLRLEKPEIRERSHLYPVRTRTLAKSSDDGRCQEFKMTIVRAIRVSSTRLVDFLHSRCVLVIALERWHVVIDADVDNEVGILVQAEP